MDTDSFQQVVRDFYHSHGRNLPWRNTEDQYAIFVSEIMLQQTQANRVIPKYREWIKRWPDFSALAVADKDEVLKLWQGLGYNRRALYLYRSAQQIIDDHEGNLPEAGAVLKKLPGVGPYTAGALQAFCFHKPVVFVETNIRTVFIHHFFANQKNISDETIKQKVGETLPETDIREWYWGLMDYGHHLKQEVGNLNNRSDTYQKQSKFDGSNRQLRSQLLQFVLTHQPVSLEEMADKFTVESERQKSVKTNLQNLQKDGLLTRDENGHYHAK